MGFVPWAKSIRFTGSFTRSELEEEKTVGSSSNKRHTSGREGKAMGNWLFWLCSKQNQFSRAFTAYVRNCINTRRSAFDGILMLTLGEPH
jgi:hypothetical protein